MNPEAHADFAPRPTRLWDLILGFHVVAGAAWWWLMPGGFPWSHPRFWNNRVAPILVVAIAALGVRALQKRNVSGAAAIVTAVPAFWTGVFTAACLLFPISAWRFAAPGILAVGVLWAAWYSSNPVSRRPWRRRHWVWGPALLLSAFVAWSQGAPSPRRILSISLYPTCLSNHHRERGSTPCRAAA